jgi:hypothetical protein
MVGQGTPQPLEITGAERDRTAPCRPSRRVGEPHELLPLFVRQQLDDRRKALLPARWGTLSSSTTSVAPHGVVAFAMPRRYRVNSRWYVSDRAKTVTIQLAEAHELRPCHGRGQAK